MHKTRLQMGRARRGGQTRDLGVAESVQGKARLVYFLARAPGDISVELPGGMGFEEVGALVESTVSVEALRVPHGDLPAAGAAGPQLRPAGDALPEVVHRGFAARACAACPYSVIYQIFYYIFGSGRQIR